MTSLNEVKLLGNLVKDPEIRANHSGGEVANLVIATSESWKTKEGEKKEKTEFHRVTIFSTGLVGLVKNYLKKGSRVLVGGQLQTSKWQDKEGRDRYTTEVVIKNNDHKLIMLDAKKESSPADYQAAKNGNVTPEDNEVPF